MKKSKSPAKLNEKTDTPEVPPAHSAAILRAKHVLEMRTKEKPLPLRRYEIGDMVEVPEDYIPWRIKRLLVAGCEVGMVIAGYEWGGYNRLLLGECWYYFLREFDCIGYKNSGVGGSMPNTEAIPIPERLIIRKMDV